MSTKIDNLRAIMASYGKLAVALSGGMDSSSLLAFAADVLGADKVLALTIKTPYMPKGENAAARALCKKLGVRFLEIVRAIPESVLDNPKDRCYLCKRELFTAAAEAAAKLGFTTIADGTNADDISDYRPGMRALKELGVHSPFLECGIGKDVIRKIANSFGLAEFDRPPNACLLTRIAHGERVGEDILERIDRAEDFIRSLGCSCVRVRVRAGDARIELDPSDIREFVLSGNSGAAFLKLKDLGFNHVSLDMGGYRMGAMS